MSEKLLIVALAAWTASAWVMVLFDRDYGRSWCWQARVQVWATTLFLLPLTTLLGIFTLADHLRIRAALKDTTHER